MSFNSGPPPTQTVTHQMTPQQEQLFNLAMPAVQKWMDAGPPKLFPGGSVVGFDPAQVRGQNMALASAAPQAKLANAAQAANRFLLGKIWDPTTNPYLQQAIDASIRPITERYQQVVRPGLRDEFVNAGQIFGGSQRNKADMFEAENYLRAVGDTASKLVQNQYENNLKANLQALGMVPLVQQAQLAPALTVSGVGDVRQNLAQAMRSAQAQDYYYDQMAPFLQAKDIMSLISGIPGGVTIATGSVPQANPTTNALGGASLGTALTGGNPLGMGVGALLGLLLGGR